MVSEIFHLMCLEINGAIKQREGKHALGIEISVMYVCMLILLMALQNDWDTLK